MTRPMLRATDDLGRALDDPDGTALHDLIADMREFVVLERLDREPVGQHYIQVRLEAEGVYRVEYREGGADRHYLAFCSVPRSEQGGLDPVCALLTGWAADRPGWRDEAEWDRLTDEDLRVE